MTLDVETPPPPSMPEDVDAAAYDDVAVQGDEYHRRELAAFLRDGAWEEAFRTWAESTELSPEEFGIVRDLKLFREFEFFWDSFAGRVGYHAPGIPEDWKERDLHPSLDSWSAVSAINASLTELGQVASEVLKEEYVDWEDEYEAPDDLPDF